MNAEKLAGDAQQLQPEHTKTDDKPVAWEQLEPGRYMPRRIRGSFRGRELG